MALYLVISKRYRITLKDGILEDVVVEERSLGKSSKCVAARRLTRKGRREVGVSQSAAAQPDQRALLLLPIAPASKSINGIL